MGPTARPTESFQKHICSPATHELSWSYQHSSSPCLLSCTQRHPGSYPCTQEITMGRTIEKPYKLQGFTQCLCVKRHQHRHSVLLLCRDVQRGCTHMALDKGLPTGSICRQGKEAQIATPYTRKPSAPHRFFHSFTVLFPKFVVPKFGVFSFFFWNWGRDKGPLLQHASVYNVRKPMCTLKIMTVLLVLHELCGAKQTGVSQDFQHSNIIPLVFN